MCPIWRRGYAFVPTASRQVAQGGGGGRGQICPATESRHSKQSERGRIAIGLPRRAGRRRGNERRDSAVARDDFTNRNQSAAADCRAEPGQSQSDSLSSGGFRGGFKSKSDEGRPG